MNPDDIWMKRNEYRGEYVMCGYYPVDDWGNLPLPFEESEAYWGIVADNEQELEAKGCVRFRHYVSPQRWANRLRVKSTGLTREAAERYGISGLPREVEG